MIGKCLIILTLWCVCASIIPPPARALSKKEHLQDEQREMIAERMGKFKDLNDVGSKPIGELLDDKAFGEFFEKFGYALTVIQISDKIASAKDKDAIIMIGEEGFKYALKIFYPRIENALGWFTWVKKGMELFKEFVFDPWLFRQQVETYIARRAEGLEPELAFASLLAWGHIRERALKLLEKQGYNMELLWVKGEKGVLSEKWEAKLETFIIAEFEMQYARKLIKEAAAKARRELPELERQAHELLKKKMSEQKAVDKNLAQKSKTKAPEKKKQDEPAPDEDAKAKTLSIESVDVSPKEAKAGETVYLKVVYGVSGLAHDETLTAKSKISVTGKQKMPFPEQGAEISGKKARKGIAQTAIEANAAFGKKGNYAWNYTITIPGLEPLKGSIPFTVGHATRRFYLQSADVAPKVGMSGDKFILNVKYGVEGVSSGEKTSGTASETLTGPENFPIASRAIEIDGGKVKEGAANLALTSNATLTKPGAYTWNYAIDAQGYDTLKGSVPFKINPMTREITLKSREISPKSGKTQETVDVKIVYGVRGLAQGKKTPGKTKIVCTGPETVSEPEINMEFDGTKWLSIDVVENEHLVFAKPGTHTCYHELHVEGYQTFKGSFPISIAQAGVASVPVPPGFGVGGCRATDAAAGGIPGICLACPISIPWNWGESNVPIQIPYKDTGGDITTLHVTSTISYQGGNETNAYSFNVTNEMRGTTGTYRWPGLADLFAAPSTLKLVLFVTDRAGNNSNTAECSMMVSK